MNEYENTFVLMGFNLKIYNNQKMIVYSQLLRDSISALKTFAVERNPTLSEFVSRENNKATQLYVGWITNEILILKRYKNLDYMKWISSVGRNQ